jgi:Fic family protein
MKATDFSQSAPGRLVRVSPVGDIPPGIVAFVPNPLPPKLTFDMDTIRLLDEASRAVGELAGVGRMLPNPHLLISPLIHREAILSSKIEGTIASMRELALFERRPSERASEVREVANYVATTEYGLKRLNDLPLSLRLIRELHERLLEGVRGSEYLPGEFRRGQNYIASLHEPITQARFVPPPAQEMMQALYDYEAFLNSPHGLPPLIHLALCHYQFETIHPFTDGNGRIGRLLISLQLCAWNLLPAPLLYLSAHFERNRSQYSELLLKTSQTGKWLDWIAFFLRGVTEQSRDAVSRSHKLLGLWNEFRHKLQTARSSALQLRLIDELFNVPAITASRARELLDVSQRSAQMNIDKLVEAKVLIEATGRAAHRVYIAPSIIDIVEA